MQQVKYAGSTNNADGSVIKVVSAEGALTWVSPAENELFTITPDAVFPNIVFEFRTIIPGDYQWSWAIEWQAKTSGLREQARERGVLESFKEAGEFVGNSKIWTVDFSGRVLGGKLTVTVIIGQKTLVRTVWIAGQNPTQENVATYVASLEDMNGFEKLLQQETNAKHFINFDGEPIVAFDKGYGITQMTSPAPSYEQAWSWKANIVAGSSIYRDKVRIAKKYLAQAGRTYTDDQLRHEVFSHWNGGSYHVWDADSASWIRKKNVLCDSNTGNIGWSMDNEKNKDKIESELHERDKDTYKKGTKGQSDDHPWGYKGGCYADHVIEK
ncbi:hypothetical protein [Pseudomonas agarici]|uniref:hypothetical protein n=1 Tax=Pseudomonas agarici TaxID=46677 RepID=UPI0015A18F31|nr:hypothetical protein [Pseudomonas agarici]NWB94243.1 hypothetical protein [Pseudomonas agarici]